MQNDLIIVKEYCDKCHIDPTFVLMLEEDGLIDIMKVGNEKYIPTSQLLELEKYTRLYYDLSINVEGIDAIQHLLNRLESMQSEIHQLRRQLSFYRLKEYEDI